MFIDCYPKVESIVVPGNIRADCIGKYVSQRASEFLQSVVGGDVHRKSLHLRPISERLWVLMYDDTQPAPKTDETQWQKESEVSAPLSQTLQTKFLNPAGPSEVESLGMALRVEERPIKTNKPRGAK